MIRRVRVLYEDQSVAKDFPLHDLVCRCICDRIQLQPWDRRIKAIEAWPLKGNGNVLVKCREDLDDLANRNVAVFVVYEEDKIRDLSAVADPTLCHQAIVRKLVDDAKRHQPKGADKLHVRLLERNLETLLEALRSIDDSLVDPSSWTAALEKKDLEVRDRILRIAAGERSALRDKLCAEVPSFDRLVQRIVEVVK